MTDLIETRCRCGVTVMESPRSTVEALCIECRFADTGARANYDPRGEWHPTVGYASPGQGAPYVAPTDVDLPPSPEVTSRETGPIGASKPVYALEKYGFDAGWQTIAQYSRGTAARYRGQWQTEELWAVRFALPGFGAYALYRAVAGTNSWTWRSVWIWGDTLLPYGKCGVAQLKEWLTAAGMVAPSWYEEISKLREAQTLAAKVVACPAAGCIQLLSHSHRANGDVKMVTKRRKEDAG